MMLRVQLNGFGVWTTYRAIGEEHAGEAAALAEDLGYTAFWLGGSPRLPVVRPLLEASEGLVVGTSIVNVWQYEPAELAAEHAELTGEFDGRLIVGIGIGHSEATSEYRSPLATMRGFLDGLDQAETPLPAGERALAALGPKMLELSGKRSLGSLPYFTPVEHTRFAREQLGQDALLAVELACVLDADADRGRAKAREYAKFYLKLRNYTNNLLRFGFSEQDIAGEGSDRLVDTIVPHGSAEEIAAAARAHMNAGADHVCLQAVGGEGVPRDAWTALAAVLTS